MKRVFFAATALVCMVSRLPAPPPLVTGDVPTADKHHFEWYVGMRYQESDRGTVSRQLPFTEIVYGISDRQEVTFETAYLSERHEHGFGDSVVGTKYVFVREREKVPGISGSFELKLPTGDKDRGLGSGEFDYDLRLRAQKTWNWFTLIGNTGYTFITEPTIGGARERRDNVWLLSTAQEYELAKEFRLLSEIYWFSREAPGAPNTLAGQIGFKYYVRDNLNIHGAIGKSLREGNEGGPDIRGYLGLKWEFGPFPRTKQ
jgi:Putative MetA-pathway of phenol degradation